MPIDPQQLADLTAKMRQLGLPDPERAARRELETGQPILATQSFLKWLVAGIEKPADYRWIDRTLRYRENHPAFAPALERLLAAGVDRADLQTVVRAMQFHTCEHVCTMLDQVALPGQVPVQDFGAYLVGGGDSPATDKPIARLDALHEQIGGWDPFGGGASP